MRLFVVTPRGVEEGMPLAIAKTDGAPYVPLLTDSPDSEPCLRVIGFEPQATRIVRASLREPNGELPTLVPEEQNDPDSKALVLIRTPAQKRDRSGRHTHDVVERFVDNGEMTTRVWVVRMMPSSEIRTYFCEKGGVNHPFQIRWNGRELTTRTR